MAADGTITFNTKLDNKELEKQYKDLEKKAKKMEETLKKSDEKKSGLQKMFEEASAAAEQAHQKIRNLNKELEHLQQVKTGEILEGDTPLQQIDAMVAADERIPQVKAQIAETTKEYNKQVTVVDRISQKLDEEAAAHEKITTQLNDTAAAAGDVRIQIEKTGKYKGLVDMLEAAKEKATGLLTRINKLAARVFVFTMITRALRAIREYLGEVISQDAEAMHAINSLKGALVTLATPIIQVVIPAFTKFVNILTTIISYMARGVSAIFGKSIEETIAAAKKMSKQSKDEAKSIKEVGKAAKGASRYLAGFDELNLAAGGSDSGSSGNNAADLGALDEKNSEGINEDKINEKLKKIMAIIAGALLAIGALLCFSGINIPLGLTLMAIGAMMLYGLYKEDWEKLSDETKKAITTFLVIAGIVLVVLGIILCFTGVAIPLGVGMIAAGMALLIAAAALNWGSMSDDMKKAITELLVVVGIIAIVLGCILAFSGVNIPIGIALIALGAAALIAAAALNWDTLKPLIMEHLDIIMIVGIVAIVLGIILCLTGVGVPLGVALILLGAASLITAAALNWDFFKQKLAEIWAGVKSFWNEHIRPIFTVQWWSDKAHAIAEGLKNGIKVGINGAIGLLNRFIGWVNEKLHIKWEPLVIAGKEIVPAVDYQLFKLPEIPQLAQGAVIPPNRTFLAELGDQTSGMNLETPEALMRQIVREETGNGEILNLLQMILSAVEDGHVIMVDRRVLGQVTREQLNNMVRMGGTV